MKCIRLFPGSSLIEAPVLPKAAFPAANGIDASRLILVGGLTLWMGAAQTFATEPDSTPRPLAVAHRGLLRHAPENTLSNFRACLELRLGFEFDVRHSQDGHLVCIHDETVDRTTDGSGRVSELSLAELQNLDAGSWFDPAFRGEQIPTVDEVFRLISEFPGPAVLAAVDLKGDDEHLERDVVELAKKHDVLDRLLFIGRAIHVPEVRERLQKAAPQAQVAALADTVEEFPAALADEQADWVYLRFLPDAEQVAEARQAEKRVFLAGPTVAGSEPRNWRKAKESGVDAILTDYPLVLKQVLRTGPRPKKQKRANERNDVCKERPDPSPHSGVER